MISFDNTEYAFAAKTKKELKRAYFLFSIMNIPWLIKLGLKITPVAIKLKLPFIQTLIRNTIFHQFVGGETLEQTALVANRLEKYNVQVILDYGAEGGKNGEYGFDYASKEFIRVINYASTQKNIHLMSLKITAIARFFLLEKLNTLMEAENGSVLKKYLKAVESLSKKEKEEWHKVRLRLLRICQTGYSKKVGVLIDAEETWIQMPIDALAITMMDIFNKQQAFIYNTVQLYRHDRLQFLKDSYQWAVERDFVLGIKLVRGAYMEKERKRAHEMNYPSPIHQDKISSDKDYNVAIEFCLENLYKISVIIASHNEESNLLATETMRQKNIPFNHMHVHFSQLYGMSDNISFNLVMAGYSVSKYLPFGPIKEVIPYLMRRAQENSSVGGQSGRELALIREELKRRN